MHFNLTRAEDVFKVALTLQAIPLANRGPFNNIIDWPTFKTKLIEEFGSVDIFRETSTKYSTSSLATSRCRRSPKTSPLRSRPCRPTWTSWRTSTTRRIFTGLHSPSLWYRILWKACLWKWGHLSMTSSPNSANSVQTMSDLYPCSYS